MFYRTPGESQGPAATIDLYSAVKKSLPIVSEYARLEGLDAHGESVRIRLD